MAFPLHMSLPLASAGTLSIGESLRVARCECKDCGAHTAPQVTYFRLPFSGYNEINPAKVDRLNDHQYSLLPSHMFAFVLNDREYGESGNKSAWAEYMLKAM